MSHSVVESKIYEVHSKDTSNHEYNIQYSLTDDGELYTLLYSNHSSWRSDLRGTVVMSLMDDGDGFKIVSPIGRREKGRIGYDEIAEYYTLISFINHHDPFYSAEIREYNSFTI